MPKSLLGTCLGLAVLLGCAHKIQMGMLPSETSCLAILPFEIQASTRSQKELLSEFIELDLDRKGFTKLLGSREIKSLFEQGNMSLPNHFNTETISVLGGLVGVDHVLFGYISDIPLIRGEANRLSESQIGVDAFLLDIRSSEIKWTYSLKKIVEGRDNVEKWGEISQDMVHALISNQKIGQAPGPCWKTPGNHPLFANVKVEKKATREVSQDVQALLDLLRTKGVELKSSAFLAKTNKLNKSAIESLHRVFDVFEHTKPNETLVVSSHVDPGTNEAEDLKLSLARGEVVKKYLMKLGAKSNKVQVVSHGSTQPIVPNITQKSRDLNRRIQLKLQSVKNDSNPR